MAAYLGALTASGGQRHFQEDGVVDGIDREPRTDRFAHAGDVRSRALAMWPRLDPKKLARTCGDPRRVASLVERRTALPRESILRILQGRSSHGM